MPNFYGNPSHHSYFDVFSGQTVSLTDTPINSADGKPLTTIDFGIKNYAEGALYVGILPLALAIYGLIRRRTVHQIIMALLGLASLTFMFGLPTYALLYILPGINQLHSPFRWVFPLTLCVALLAGFGMDALLESAEKWAKRFGVALVAVGALTLIGLLLSRLFYPQIAPLDRAHLQWAGASAASLQRRAHVLQLRSRQRPDLRRDDAAIGRDSSLWRSAGTTVYGAATDSTDCGGHPRSPLT